MEDEKRIGLIQVYTGTGKGKTTAALGQVLRAVGRGQKASIIQFMKGETKYGESKSLKKLNDVEIERYGRAEFVNIDDPSEEDIELARNGLDKAEKVISSGKYNIVVLDEINMALDCGLLEEEEVLDVIDQRPKHVEIILTGRSAPASVIDMADLVTVMTEVKHPFKEGIEAREGIEY